MSNNKFIRIIAIIALVLISVFSVTFVMYLADKTLFNGAIGYIAAWNGGIGLLLSVFLWLSRAFPSQKEKDKARAKLQQEYDELTAKEEDAEKDNENSANQSDEQDLSKDGTVTKDTE